MALTIDELQIKIESDAKKATSGIDSLADSLQRLSDAIGDTSGLAANLSKISGALQTFSSVGKINIKSKVTQLQRIGELVPTLGGGQATQLAQNLRDIAGAMTAFSAVPKISITSFANGIHALNSATASFDSSRLKEFSKQMTGIANGLSKLNKVNASSIGSAINGMRKIPELTASLDPATIDAFASACDRLAQAVSPLASQMRDVAAGFNALPRAIRNSIAATNGQVAANGRLKASNNGLFKSLSNVVNQFKQIYHAVNRLLNVLTDWFEVSNEFVEALNLFNVSMGEASDSALEFAETVSDVMGIDIAEWITNQGSFMRMATGFGIASDSAEIMSQNLTQLAYDMSSFFNVDVQTAMDKLQSGMSGQIKGLKEWGYNLSVAALQETALSLGIEQSVRTMTEAQKAQLRYITLIQRSNGIMGDMAKTIMSPANSMRILGAQITKLQRALGNIVSVLATRFIPYVMAAVEIMEEFASSLAEAWGYEVLEFPEVDLELGADIEEEVEVAEDAVNELKRQLMGFDELNILKSDDSDADNVPSYDLGIDMPEYDFLKGLEGLDLEPYKEKLSEIWDIVKNIGIAFTTWKIGSGVLSLLTGGGGLGGLSGLFGKKTGETAKNTGKNLMGFTGTLLALAGAFFEFIGVTDALGEGFDLKNVLETVFGTGGVLGGGAMIGSAFFGTAVGGVAGGAIASGAIMAITSAVESFINSPDLENLILTPIGTAIAGAGIGFFVGGPIGAVIGAGIGAIVGLVSDLAALFVDDAVKAVEIFDKTISESTKTKVEPFVNKMRELSDLSFEWEVTGAKLGNYSVYADEIESIKKAAEEAGRELTVLEEERITELEAQIAALEKMDLVDVADFTDKVNECVKIIETELMNDKTIQIEMLTSLSSSGYLSGTDLTSATKSINGYYAGQEEKLKNHQSKINEIMTTAANEHRELTADEWSEVYSIQSQMQEMGVYALSDSAIEAETIMRNLKDNTTRVSLEQASEIIKNAQTTRDETIAAAENQYSEIKLQADNLLEVGAINETEYQAIIDAADQARQDTISDADTQYSEILRLTKEKLGETAKYIDEETGEIKSNWEMFWDSMAGQKIEKAIKNIGVSLANIAIAIINIVPMLANGVLDLVEGAINMAAELADSLPGVQVSPITIDRMKPMDYLEFYASGGFPTMGQMFIAREAGPELVGRIGNKNAVVNNDQIISGIAAGVYSAMMAAQEDGGGNEGGNARIVVQIGDTVVGEAAVRFINGKIIQTGVSPIYG